MFKIIGSSSTGKTERLMRHAKEIGATIVCKNPDSFAYKAQAYGIIGLNFISYEDYLSEMEYFNDNEKFLVDEIDGLLRALQWNIVGYCITTDD